MAIGVVNFPTSLDTLDTLIKATDNASTTLTSAINSTTNVITVASTATFASSGLLAIDNELITYTGKTSLTFTGCVRGFNGTTGASHGNSSLVENVDSSAYHNTLAAALVATQTKLGAGATTNRAIVSDGSGNYAASAVTFNSTDTAFGNVGALDFDTTPAGTGTTARLVWNDTDGTLDLGTKGGNVTLHVGQQNLTRVVNKTGAQLTKAAYKIVRAGGAQGQRLSALLAQGNSEANSTDILGLVAETIDNNQEGFIVQLGLVDGINTTGSLQSETWADGDVLYLSPTIAGGLTKVKPVAPNHLVIAGYVVYAHANNGKIFVHHASSWELDELHSVLISSPTNGQSLVYESATGLWKNQAVVATPAGASGSYQYNNAGALGGGSLSEGASLVTSSVNFRVPSGGSASATTLQLGAANTGFYLSSGSVAVSSAGAAMMLWNGSNGQVTIPSGYQHTFGSSGLSSPDLGLIRHAAGVLRITNADGSSGQLLIGASGATAGGQAHVISSAAGTTGLRVDSAASPTSPILDVRVNGTADSGIKVDASTTTGDTRFFLYDATAGTIKRVLVGAADSGGSGFKMLRVAN